MNKKYELVPDDTIGRLTRIRALRDIPESYVKAGDLGGYIEVEFNLSHEGGCWVYDNARILGRARISGNARASGNSCVSGNSYVTSDAHVSGNSCISGNSCVSGNSCISGNARVTGNSCVTGDSRVFGSSSVSGDAYISGTSRIKTGRDYCVFSRVGEAVGYICPTLEQESTFTQEDYEQDALKNTEAWKNIKKEDLLDIDFWYWRKFNHLHGWMRRLYQTKGGTNEDFNCSSVRLTLEDLDRLKKDIQDNKLVPEEGFFFGGSEIYPEDIERTLEFIEKSSEVLKTDTYAIFYTSWW